MSIEVGVYNFTIRKGQTFYEVLTYKDSTGALVNLTGYTAKMQIKFKKDDVAYIQELSTSNSKITLGGALGTITLNLTATETLNLPLGLFYYGIDLINGATVIPLMEGEFNVQLKIPY